MCVGAWGGGDAVCELLWHMYIYIYMLAGAAAAACLARRLTAWPCRPRRELQLAGLDGFWDAKYKKGLVL